MSEPTLEWREAIEKPYRVIRVQDPAKDKLVCLSKGLITIGTRNELYLRTACSCTDDEILHYFFSKTSWIAFSSSFLGKAPCATCGWPSTGMKTSVGRLVIPKAAASSLSFSVSTL